ncbi:MAG: heavy-metal-associated domain-containing protein [Gammaproteobacteria bacterium]|nr:heavy-metal-associated domain-containing protein [Gammaproteobacteria bacterium]
MAVEEFKVQNVKCGGCVKAIQDGLTELPGIDSVEVSIEGGEVKVEGEDLSRESLSAKLGELGYPEA